MQAGNGELIWKAIYDCWEIKKKHFVLAGMINCIQENDSLLPYNVLRQAAARNVRFTRHSTDNPEFN